MEQSADPDVVHVVTGPLLVGAVLSIPRQRAVDDGFVARFDGLVVDVQPSDHARSEPLDDHVRGLGELHERLVAALVLQVECDAPFVSVEHREDSAVAVGEFRVLLAVVIAHPGLFDLDHVRAEIAEKLGRIRTGQQPREIQHANALKW